MATEPQKSSKTSTSKKLKTRTVERVNKYPPTELSALTRALEFAFDAGNRNQAHAAVDSFFNRFVKNKKTLEIGDPVSMLVPPQLANILEAAGYMTIGAVLHAKPEEIRDLQWLGAGRFNELIDALRANGFGKSTSLYPKL